MNFSLRPVFFTILLALFLVMNANAVSMSDGLTSGTILASHGGELNPFFFGGGGYYNNYAAYNPYAYSGFGRR
jgi:hypothetical protein